MVSVFQRLYTSRTRPSWPEPLRPAVVALTVVTVLLLFYGCAELFGPGDVRSVEITPTPVSLSVGDSTRLRIQVTYDDGSKRLTAADRWTTGSPDIASVDAYGTVVGLAPGFARINAWRSGVFTTTIAAIGRITFRNIDSALIARYASNGPYSFHISAPAKALDQTTIDGNRPAAQVTHWTSTAYLDSCFFDLSVFPDGRVLGGSVCGGGPQRPVGTKKVLVLIVDGGQTNIANLVTTTWAAAQDSVNRDLKGLFDSLKEQTLLQFDNTNIVVSGDSLRAPTDADSAFAYLAAHGIDRSAYDVIVSLHPDSPGAFALAFPDDFVSMDCYSCPRDLNRPALDTVARAIYDHEIGHLMGWQHAWGGGPVGTRIITDPALFGWTDTDGDGVPEIVDSTPYGMH